MSVVNIRTALLAGLAVALLPAGAALADPPAGAVEVQNEAGAAVGPPITGAGAIEAAMARIRAGTLARTDDTRPWRIVVGAGTYGSFVVDEPNLTVAPSSGAQVTISTSASADRTGGECADVTRGNVTLIGLVCRAPRDRGFEVLTPPNEGGVVLRQVAVDRSHGEGVVVSGGAGAILQDVVVTGAGGDGIRLEKLTGPGPWVVQGGASSRSAGDGIDLSAAAQRVRISGVTLDSNHGNGVRSEDSGSADVIVDGVRAIRNGGDGVLLGGGGNGLQVTNSSLSGNGRYGVEIGRGSGLVVRGDTFDGTNRGGDLAFSPDARAGGAYGALAFLDTGLDLPGEPRGVILRAATVASRLRFSPLPAGYASFNRFVQVKDAGRSSTSVVTLRYALALPQLTGFRLSALAVFEDDPPGNAKNWQGVPGTQLLPTGQVDVTLGDAQIASGSDSRFATYGPLAPLNAAPVIAAVYPAQGARVRGRSLLVSAAVGDDEPLNTGRFALYLDGKRRGGVSFANGNVVFRVGRLALGTHRASLLVVDQDGLRTVRPWTFTVLNARPTIVRRRALPRPGSFVLTHGRVRLSVPVHDDQAVARALVRVRVDGRRVSARMVHGRLVARTTLRQGRHRVVIRVSDRDGATVTRGWAFRTVRP